MRVSFGVVASILAMSSFGASAQWVSTWGAAPVPPGPGMGPRPATPTFTNQTIRQVVRISVGGNRVRIRFTNEYGAIPLRIGAATVESLDSKNGAVGEMHRVLFAGKPTVVIPAGSPLLSDPIDLHVNALSSLSISLFLPDDTGPCTCHPVGMQTTAVSVSGNFTESTFASSKSLEFRAFISGVDVEPAAPVKTIVAFGDSITDGVGSTVDANRRWPDWLADRLDRPGRTAWGVVNMGISGNRVLGDGAGQSALARFDRDVLSVPGVAYVIIFEGVNDLGISFGHFEGPMAQTFKALMPATPSSAADIIAGYRQLIERAHSRGIKVLMATIVPYEGATYYSDEGESQRQAINSWIRAGAGFDGVLDFDSIMRDPRKPTQILSNLQAGDHLHGSDLGYEAIANSIDVAVFK